MPVRPPPAAEEADPLLPLAHLPYAEQLVAREERVRGALARAGIDAPVRPIVPSPRESGARARVALKVGPGGELGFHRPGSHDFVAVPLEPLARPEIVAAAARAQAALQAHRAKVTGNVEIRTDGQRTVIVLDAPPPLPAAELGDNVAVRGRALAGEIRLTVNGLRVSAQSFFQVNLEMNERVVADVDAVLADLAPTRLLDLYAGVGNLSARAVRRGVPATLIEFEGAAATDARHNLPGAEVRTGDAGKFTAGSAFFDVAVLDPPRAGAPGVLPTLALTRPRAIVYLSCEPTTLARDVRPLLRSGYRVERVQPYDMFPGTTHVETLLVLVRV